MTGSLARRYAKALFALAQEESTVEQTGRELANIATVAADPAIATSLGNPLLSTAARRAIALTLAEKLAVRPTTRNFLALLADQQRLNQLGAIADEFRRLEDSGLGRVRARISSAAPLLDDQRALLVAAFERFTGKSVLAETLTDPDLLGGVIVEVEGKVYDGSVRTQLDQLAGMMARSGGSH